MSDEIELRYSNELFADDEPKQTNLEWMMENDFDGLCDQMSGQPCSCCIVECPEDLGSDEACRLALREWLMAPHENGIRRENDSETPIFTEIPQKTGEEGQKDDALDSREKLEADVRANCYHEAMPAGGRCWMLNDGVFESVVIGWLDRQAAITERECREYEDALREQHHKRIAELESERDEWHEKAAELEIELAQVRGNLKNVTHNYAIAKAKCEGREQSAIQRERRADEKMAEAERAIAEPPDERVRELIAKLEAERDGWRMRCGELLDAAHAMQGVADAWDEEVEL